MHEQSRKCNEYGNARGHFDVGGAVAEVLVVAGAGSTLLAVVAAGLVGDEAAAQMQLSI